MKRRCPPLFAVLPALWPLIGSMGCSEDDDPPAGPVDAGMGGGAADSGAAPPDAGPAVVRPAPTVTAVTPGQGAEVGGTRVTLRGTSFIEPVDVFFGDAAAARVVVLDGFSLAVTTPIGTVGSTVGVRVRTVDGEGILAGAFRYVRDLALEAVTPARIPERGGVEVTVSGRGFDESTLVLFDRRPLRGARSIDPRTIRGFVPALTPGRPEVRVIRRDADVRRSDLVVAYAMPKLTAIVPGYGPIGVESTHELAGDGLSEVFEVRIGGAAAGALTVNGSERVRVDAPVLAAEGAYDVVAVSADAAAHMPGGYIAYDAEAPGLAVVGITPPRAVATGGGVLTVVGRGFGADADVLVGGILASATGLGRHAVSVTVPPGLGEGPHDVVLMTGVDVARLPSAVTLYAPVRVDTVDPPTGPSSGGTAVRIVGSGFVEGMEVRIAGVPLADVAVLRSTELTARTVGGAHGRHDVVVKTVDAEACLPGGFSFNEPFEVLAIEPRDGSMAGNTHVSVFGRGFSEPVTVGFDGTTGVNPALENGSVIAVRTERHRPRRVDVEVGATGQTVRLDGAFTYFDPRLVTGGAWGGAIEGAVNVGVINLQGRSIPGMVVQLGYEADPRYAAVTDEDGLATVSSPEIRGAQTVTVGGVEVEFVTFPEINARNVTIVAALHPRSQPADAPVLPCPSQGAPAPVVRGRVFRVKSSRDPVTSPTSIAEVRITTSQSSVWSSNPGGQTVVLSEVGGPCGSGGTENRLAEGQAFEIEVQRVGTVAVYGLLGERDCDTGIFTPRRMAIARGVPVAFSAITDGVQLSFDVEMNGRTRVRLEGPPLQAPGPSRNAVLPFVNLRSDGVIPLPVRWVAGHGPTWLERLPVVAQSEFIYVGGSFTEGPTGTLDRPHSLTIAESSGPLEDGVDLGPFLEMPQNIEPKPQQVLRNGRIAWDQGGPTPDLTTLNVRDRKRVARRCCVDTNMNRQCDDPVFEPVQSSSFSQWFNRWSVYGPGGLLSYRLPRMPSGLQGFDPPSRYDYVLQTALAPRFSYEEFVLNQFTPLFWRSWVFTTSTFIVKEETD